MRHMSVCRVKVKSLAVNETKILSVGNPSSTTEFYEHNALQRDIPTKLPKFNGDVLSAASTGYVQNIKEFLAKPIIIATGTYSGSAGSTIFDIDIGPQLATQQIWWDKVKGFKYIRATAVVRVVLNMNPFQAGSLLAHFSPCWNKAGTLYLGPDRSVIGKSQRPGARIDSCNGETVLKFPYVSPYMYFDLRDPNISTPSTNNYNWGRFVLENLTSFRTGAAGQTSAQVSLYLSWEDVDLQAPVYIAQSGNLMDEEVEAVQEGTVAKAFATGQQIAKYSEGIPLLSSIAKPSWWFFGLGRSVANLFGWSKPNVGTQVSKMFVSPAVGSYVADGEDLSVPLSLLSSNKVEILSGVPGHDMDEMSIDFIKKQWAIVDSRILTTSDTGTLFFIDLNPNGFRQNVTVIHNAVNVTGTQPSPIAFLAGMFRKYRGGLKFKFRFVKTQYHTGTIAFAFAPSTALSTLTAQDLSYLHAEHVDLRTTGEYEVTVPFVSNQMYLETSRSFGRLYFHVINPLRCPESVSSSIDVVVEVCGADDLEFALPRSGLSAPMVPQSGIMEEEVTQDCQKLVSTIGYSDIVLSSRSASYGIGERVMSVLQLLKAFHKCNIKTSAVTDFVNSRDGGFNPFLLGSFNTRTVPLADTNLHLAGITGDPYSYIAPCYAFRRGGVRLQLLIQPSNALSYVSLLRDPKTSGSVVGQTWWEQPNQLELSGSDQNAVANTYPMLRKVVGQTLANAGFAQFQIPYYSHVHLTLNALPTYGGAPWANFYPHDMPDVSFQYWNESLATTLAFSVQRAVADDFQFSYWIGAPLIAPHAGIG